ncbi:hypothetical protein ACFL2Q_03420 [Thermodesulfobacteriota bacterium]
MDNLPSSNRDCTLCGGAKASLPEEEATLCSGCYDKSEALFQDEMRKVELIRTIRGMDVELYDIKHPDSQAEKQHCGQVILIRAGDGFEVKICLRAQALDWMAQLRDTDTGFTSGDNRLDALIGNVYLLVESWGGGPHYMDIFSVDQVISIEGEI